MFNEYTTPIETNKDCLDPKVKRQKIMEKADIEEICNTITGPKCPKCMSIMTSENTQYDRHRCTSCSAQFVPAGTYQKKILWICVFDPNEKG